MYFIFKLPLQQVSVYNIQNNLKLLMEKKISEIAQSFEHLKFDQTINLIEQHLKKIAKQDKKKHQPNSQEMKIIQCFRVGALISLGRYHQAASFYQQLIRPQAIEIMGKENPYLLISISELFGQKREKIILELLQKYCPTFNNQKMHRFYLNSKLFSSLSKIFLKQFMTSKNNASQLAQIYLDYLHNIQKDNMLQYGRKSYYKYNPKLNFKLIHMFLQKLLKTSQEHKAKLQKDEKEGKILLQERQKFQKDLKINRSVVLNAHELKLKLLIIQGKAIQSITLYNQIKEGIKFPFIYVESILQLKQSIEANIEINHFYLSEISRIFKKNLNADLYTPFYDHYNRFLNYLKQQTQKINKTFKKQLQLSQQKMSFESLYEFNQKDLCQTLKIYFNSLNNQYNMLTDVNNQKYEYNKKGDYYKICLKGLLLQLLQISSYINNQNLVHKFLSHYTNLFKNTLTYSHDLFKYWPFISEQKILSSPSSVISDNELIQQINFSKIMISRKVPKNVNFQDVNHMYEHLTNLYHTRLEVVQKNRTLQKGQRHISDEFLIILTDYIRIYIQMQDDKEKIFDLIFRIITELEKSIKRSPFNADLKIRLIYFLSIMNHHQELVQVYLTNDIKSVQMQTLGYLVLRPILQFDLWNRNDQFINKMIRSYHQNQRQTSQYGLKAIKAAQLDRVQQFICYRQNILNSYNSIIILYMLFSKYRLQNNSQYYLLRINSQLNKHAQKQITLTFNADAKVLHNQISAQYTFCQIYGLYNNYSILQKEVQIYLHQQVLIYSLLDKNYQHIANSILPIDKLSENIQSVQVKDIFDFSSYNFQEQPIIFYENTSKFTTERYLSMINIWKLGLHIRTYAVKLLTLFVQIIKKQDNTIFINQITALRSQILQSIDHLKNNFAKVEYRMQIRTITSVRKGLMQSLNLFNLFRQFVSKNKKLKGIKGLIEQGTQTINEKLNKTLLQLKWSNGIKCEYLIKRDQNVERQLEFDNKELKKNQAKFVNLYKI